MYSRSKKVLFIFLWIMIFETAVTLFLFELPEPGEIRTFSIFLYLSFHSFSYFQGTNMPVPGVYICADGDPPNKPFAAWWTVQSAAVEAILLGFAINNALRYYGKGYGRLVDVMRRDSVMYFALLVNILLKS